MVEHEQLERVYDETAEEYRKACQYKDRHMADCEEYMKWLDRELAKLGEW